MKTNQLLNLTIKDVSKMTEKELRQSVSVLRSTARKRYERLEKAGLYTQPMRTLSRKSPNDESVLPTVSGMDKITLRNEFKRYKAFLESKTSTVSGAKRVEQATRKMIEDVTGRNDFTDEEMTDILSMADEISLTEEIGKIQSSTERISAISQEYTRSKSKDEILKGAKERLENAYELQQQQRNLSTSQFFDNSPD